MMMISFICNFRFILLSCDFVSHFTKILTDLDQLHLQPLDRLADVLEIFAVEVFVSDRIRIPRIHCSRIGLDPS